MYVVRPLEMIPLSLFVCQPLAEGSVPPFTADSAANTPGSGKNVAWTQSWQPLQTREGRIRKSQPHALRAKALTRCPFIHPTRGAKRRVLTENVKGSSGALTALICRLSILIWGHFHRFYNSSINHSQKLDQRFTMQVLHSHFYSPLLSK